MFSKQLLALLVGAFFCLSNTLAGQYPISTPSTKTKVTVSVVFLAPVAVDAQCSHLMGAEPTGNILGCFDRSTNTIYTPEPKTFDDYERLIILGHEFWHALGADHPDIPAGK